MRSNISYTTNIPEFFVVNLGPEFNHALHANDIEYICICILRTDSRGQNTIRELHDSVAR